VSEQTAEPDVQRTLDWEATNRTKAVIAAIIGGIFVVVPTFYIGVSGVNSDAPEVGPLQALTPALSGQFAAERNPRVGLIEYWADNSGPAILAGVLLAVSMVGIAYVLWYLFHATRARRPELPAFARWLALIGPSFMGVSSIMVPLFRYLGCDGFDVAADAGNRDAVDAALGGSGVLIAAIIGLVGQLSLALAFVLIALNAMRVGLLTQFMGIIGIIVGALYVFQVGPAPILQAFWLLALVPLFLHRWPSGTPAAWTRGIAVPWPTAAERRAAMAPATAGGPKSGGGGGASSDLADDAADPRPAPNRPQHTSRKRRKR
jgi:hypothetical protein